MRIDHLTIRNFKGFEERSFDFARGPEAGASGSFHILVGDNGSGKSTTLDALAVALGIWHVARSTAGGRPIRPEDARYRLGEANDQKRFDPLALPSVSARGPIGGKEVSWTRQNKEGSRRTSNVEAKDALAIIDSLIRQPPEEGFPTLPVLAYYGAGRAWLAGNDRTSKFELNMNKVSRFDAHQDCLEGSIRHKDLNQWFLFESVEAFQRGHKRTSMQAVEQAVLSCVPGASHLRFDGDRKEIIVGLQGTEIPFYSLSDGQRSMVSMVADIAMKAAILNPHLGTECARQSTGVVLIDELDLHLHPKWQRVVVENLRSAFPCIQFVGTTHSPFVIQSVRAGELISLEEEGIPSDFYVGASIEDIVEDVQGVAMPQQSKAAQVLGEATEKYLELVRAPEAVDQVAFAAAEKELRHAQSRYTLEPGLNALLKLEALAAEEAAKAK